MTTTPRAALVLGPFLVVDVGLPIWPPVHGGEWRTDGPAQPAGRGWSTSSSTVLDWADKSEGHDTSAAPTKD